MVAIQTRKVTRVGGFSSIDAIETKPCKQKPKTHARTPNCDKIVLDGPGEARQGYSTTTQESDTALLPMSEWTNYGWDGISAQCTYMTRSTYQCSAGIRTRTAGKKHYYFFCFFTSYWISEIRYLFFRFFVFFLIFSGGWVKIKL